MLLVYQSLRYEAENCWLKFSTKDKGNFYLFSMAYRNKNTLKPYTHLLPLSLPVIVRAYTHKNFFSFVLIYLWIVF